tara:strand:- start:146 stop:604 length:459 start_codon:yes stop_codon:yes gene_type:complete
MIKKIHILILTGTLSLCCLAQKEDAEYYGEQFDIQILEEPISSKIDIFNVKDKLIQIKGEIISSCSKRGCWINIDIGDNDLFVKFKDYGFFVPTANLEGKSTIVNGKLSIDTLSVKTLRHYAEDEGKSKKEILAITEPQIKLSFLANGLIIE